MPIEEYLCRCSQQHIHHRNSRVAKPLQDPRRYLMQSEEDDADRRDHHGGTCTRGVVDERRDRCCEHKYDHKRGKADEIGDTYRCRRLIVNACTITEHARLRDGRHNAHRHGSRQAGRKVDERYRHSVQIAEELCRLTDAVARCLKALRHDHEVEIRYDRQHDARCRYGQRKLEDAFDNRAPRLVCCTRQRSQLRAVVTRNVTLQLDMEIDEDNEPRHRARKSSEGSTCRCVVKPPRHEKACEDDHRHHAEDLFHDL